MKKYSKDKILKCFMDADWNIIDERTGLKIRKMISIGTLIILLKASR